MEAENPEKQLLLEQDPAQVFELLEELAVGSFGAVYKARLFSDDQKIVAVKICSFDEETLREVQQEVCCLAISLSALNDSSTESFGHVSLGNTSSVIVRVLRLRYC